MTVRKQARHLKELERRLNRLTSLGDRDNTFHSSEINALRYALKKLRKVRDAEDKFGEDIEVLLNRLERTTSQTVEKDTL